MKAQKSATSRRLTHKEAKTKISLVKIRRPCSGGAFKILGGNHQAEEYHGQSKNAIKPSGSIAAKKAYEKPRLVIVHEPVEIFGGADNCKKTGKHCKQTLKSSFFHVFL